MKQRRFNGPMLCAALLSCVVLTACDPAPAATTSETTVDTPAGARTVQVCASGCDFVELGPALEAAVDGDTVALGEGTFEGGVSIGTSITLRGEGADRTVIEGGGPVVTIGEYDAAVEPTVTIEGLTITGGVTRSSPEAEEAGLPGAEALGGGVFIPPAIDRGLGATVTLRDVAVTENLVATTSFEMLEYQFGGLAPSSGAMGGGIDSWGDLTLERTVVRGNLAGAATGLSDPGMTSYAHGAGIKSHQGHLTIVDSEVSGNVASVTSPNGRYAEGAGLHIEDGVLMLIDSTIEGNRAESDVALPEDWAGSVGGGGIWLVDGVTQASIEGTAIIDNVAMMTNSVGKADANSGGLGSGAEVDLTVDGATILGNEVIATTTGRSRGDAFAAAGAAGLAGTTTDTVVEGNTITARSKAGDAFVAGAGLIQLGLLDGCQIRSNVASVQAPLGRVEVDGGGIWVAEEPLTIRDSTVADNRLNATARAGWVRGAGISQSPAPGDGEETSSLEVRSSTITGNSIQATSPIRGEGGGLYGDAKLIRWVSSTVSGNSPDDCAWTSGAETACLEP